MSTKRITKPRSLKRSLRLMPRFPVRLTLEDQQEFYESMGPQWQTEAEEVWAAWVKQNEELAWAIAEKYRREEKAKGRQKAPAEKLATVSHSGNPMLEPKLSVVEAAKLLGIGATRLRELVNDGEIPFVKMGGKYLFFERDLAEFIQKRYMRSKPTPATSPNARALPEHIRNSPLLTKGGKAA